MIKMKFLLVAIFAVAAAEHAHHVHVHSDGDSDSNLEVALRPLYSQLDVFRDQLDAVKALVHVPCRKGAPKCDESGPLGMEDGRITDDMITASSMWNDRADHGPTRARLNLEVTTGAAAWANGGPDETDPWIQVSFASNKIITGVITQGRGDTNGDYDQWVTEYKVAYSDDGIEWTDVTELGSCEPTKFPGNSDHNTHVTSIFPKAFQARFLRILPTQYQTHCSMRFEVLGCDGSDHM